MKNIFLWLSGHGLVLMLVGFFIAVAGLLFYMQTRFSGSVLPQIAFGITVAGLIVYIAGRVLVATQRRKKRSSMDN